MPLFTGCYDEIDERRSARLFEYMKVNGAFNFDGGIPTSMIKGTGEQWDFPNGWSPLNHIIIEGLRKSENAEMWDQNYDWKGNIQFSGRNRHSNWPKNGFWPIIKYSRKQNKCGRRWITILNYNQLLCDYLLIGSIMWMAKPNQEQVANMEYRWEDIEKWIK